MVLTELEQLLQQRTGFDPRTVGGNVLRSALTERLAALGLSRWEEYLERVRRSPEELQAFIDASVIPETWFFRGMESFACLAELVLARRAGATAGDRVRILSVPCASGEEPYSIAMTLLEKGLSKEHVAVEAVDISNRVLDRARRGVYGDNSFRGEAAGSRERFFERVADGYAIRPEVRALVEFSRGNLLDAPFWEQRGPYDFVFCRNVLIYFDRPTQARVAGQLRRCLRAEGVLFAGPAEAGIFSAASYVPLRKPRSFAFRRPAPESIPPAIRPGRKPRSGFPACRPAPNSEATPSRFDSEPPIPVNVDVRTGLEAVATLADRGELSEAARCCREHLERNGPSAQAHYLLGLVEDAGGNSTEAALQYRKALYLDPNHLDAVAQLALLVERTGDSSASSVLRARVRRLQQRRKP